MNKRWRPKGWNPVIVRDSAIRNLPPDSLKTLAYVEAGADAMLDALFKLASESPTKTLTLDCKDDTNSIKIYPDYSRRA